MNKLKVKIFSSHYIEILENDINNFIKYHTVKDIKFNGTRNADFQESTMYYAMVIYERL